MIMMMMMLAAATIMSNKNRNNKLLCSLSSRGSKVGGRYAGKLFEHSSTV